MQYINANSVKLKWMCFICPGMRQRSKTFHHHRVPTWIQCIPWRFAISMAFGLGGVQTYCHIDMTSYAKLRFEETFPTVREGIPRWGGCFLSSFLVGERKFFATRKHVLYEVDVSLVLGSVLSRNEPDNEIRLFFLLFVCFFSTDPLR